MMSRTLLGTMVISMALAASACGGSDTVAATPLVGSYQATEFVTTGASGQTNQLVAGGSLTITLLSNHTTTGHLHIASPSTDADMAGTWTQTGNTVTFSQQADTFVRDMPFTIVPGPTSAQLVGDHVFSGTRIQLTLTRSS